MNKKPNKFLAPIIIAGVTIGFLASAYKYVFAKSDTHRQKEPNPNKIPKNSESYEQS